MLAVAAVALAAPALASAVSGSASAVSGGASAVSGSAGVWSQSSATVASSPANLPVTASSSGITITTQESNFLRTGVAVTGTAPASDAGDVIEIDERGSGAGAPWTQAALAPIRSGGSFAAVWAPGRNGQFTIRAELQGTQATASAPAPAVTVTVYRRSLATLYGPGFWGQQTACGEVLRRRTLGVANRTLKCGTPVAIYYKGRTLTVPVIDRGPYAHGANWDLTMATARALGIPGTAVIGAAPVPTPETGTAATATAGARVPAAQ